MLKLIDNTGHENPLNNKKNKKKYADFLSSISDKTIKELDDEGGILVWPHSFKDCKDNNIAKMKILEYRDNFIQTNNLVGFIGNGEVEIEINSRFSVERETTTTQKKQEKKGAGKTEVATIDYFLYYMLSKVFSANIVNLEVGGGSLKELDFLFFVFPRLLKSAMQQGMYKKYVKKEYNDSNIRGVININRHIRYNNPPNGRIAYSTREFSYDNDITQLIRHTIEYMNTTPLGRTLLNSDKEIERYTRQVIQVTPQYQKGERRRVITANRTPLSHPYYNRYKALQQICLAILRKEKMSHGSMNNKVHGLLIDVAWLWEEYIGITMREAGFAHHTSDNAFKLFERTDEVQFQNIIPDYVWEQEGKNVIADAKYIPLDEYHHINADKASAVYYKTIMYMYRFATNIGILFHPCKPKEDANMQVTFNDYLVANGRNCHLYKVGLVIPDCKKYNEYKDFKEELEKREISFNDKVKRHCFTHFK